VGATVQRAEETGRGPMRGRRQLVTARGLAPPAVTAEVGAPLLAPKGVLLVSEPPGGDARRWPPEPLRELGLETAGVITQPAAVQILVRRGSVPDRYPRRVGVPGKRPLWS
jgi:16S rRNA (guanine527-N7)-methyltransferase